MTRRSLFLTLLTLALLAACDRSRSPGEGARELQVGSHAISLVPLPGWEYLDYGGRVDFRRGFERIAIEDFGSTAAELDDAAAQVMTRIREVERRAVASREHFQVDGRDAVTVDTWEFMSHQYRKRFTFVANGGSTLGIYMVQGSFEAMDAAFDSLIASVAFTDSPAPED